MSEYTIRGGIVVIRLEKVKKYLNKHHLDALIITSPINRLYMTGFTGSSGIVVITKQDQFLLTDFRYIEQATEEASSFKIVRHTAAIETKVAELLKDLKVKQIAFEADHVTYSQYDKLTRLIHGQLTPTTDIIENIRIIKSADELQTMKKASKIADQAYEHILTFIKPGMKEIEVAHELESFMKQAGAAATSFDSIVASGWRSALPHGIASEKVIEEGELVTLDFGAIYEGYCSDITRTLAVGEISEELTKIYNIVLAAQEKSVAKIKPGMTGQEADAIARVYINEAGYGKYFGHSTGHGLGLEVHEQPTLSMKSETVLKPGMVVTVEPGIYIPDLGGCRIEDDIVITETGNERLTVSTKKLIHIE